MRLGGSLNSLRASAALSKIQLGELTAVEYEESVAAIDAAAANKGFFASMGLVGWAVIAVTAFATVWGMVSEKIDKAKQSMGEEENNLRTQQHEYKTLSDIIKDSTKSVEERNDAIKEITAKYPEYNKQSNLENLTEKEKNEILDKGNDLFETRIRLQGKKDALTDISKKLAAAEFDRDKKKQKLDQTTIKNEEDGKDPNDKVKKEWFGATSGEGVDYNNAQKIVDDIQADYDLAYKGTKSSDEEEKPEKRAAKLLEDTTKTAELTNDAIDKYVKELKEIEGKLKNNSELSKKVNERMDSLGKLRSGKTGSPGLGSTLEDTKITLQNLTEISDLYGAIDEKWSKIDDLQVKDKKGVEDPSKTKNERIKGKYKIREELEKNIDNLLKDKTKASETETESKGGDKLEVLQAKLKTMQSIINQVNEESKKWDAKDRDKFPVISKQKRDEWANDIKKTQNEINKASFDDSTKTMQQEEEYITKRMELENSGDMEKLLLKQEYLEKELELAKKFHQTEKAEEIQHKLNLLDVDKEEAAKRILQNSRDVNYDLKISKAGRTKIAPNVSDEYNASTLEEEKKYNDDLEKIKENTLLTDAQKKSISEELEKAHQERIHDIKRKYYDSWLGELTGLSRLEIEGVSQVFQQLETTANTLMNMQSKKGQEDADNYRKTENDKLDIQKKAALASARTDQQKQKIEDDYTKKKDKIDDEANAKGQERIKTMFAIQKAASIANAIISTYEGADKALGAYPPPIGAILMAATIAAGLANVAAISAQEPPKFAIGGLPGAILGFMTRPQGFIQGPGSGTSDSILARISNKEFIVNAAATERNRMLLEQINKGSFSSGGYAGNGSYLSSLTNISNVDTGTVNEIKALSDRVDKLSNNLIDMMDRISSQPVAIGDEACRRITSKGIGRMKRSKSIL
jgi:hypothetical protein